jgi:hypothetical protein
MAFNGDYSVINPLSRNGTYRSHTAPLTSKRCILYIYLTNIGTKYFKHAIRSPFFPLKNAVCFIIVTYLVPVLFTFYVQGVLKLKKNNSGAKRLSKLSTELSMYHYILSCLIVYLHNKYAITQRDI